MHDFIFEISAGITKLLSLYRPYRSLHDLADTKTRTLSKRVCRFSIRHLMLRVSVLSVIYADKSSMSRALEGTEARSEDTTCQ
jgi:hypothetical protein